jgi:hypothetical protein
MALFLAFLRPFAARLSPQRFRSVSEYAALLTVVALPFGTIFVDTAFMGATDYFRAELSAPISRGFDWKAYGQIIRNDTGEPVKHLSATAETAEMAQEKLARDIKEALAVLHRPRDWGRDPTVPGLIRDYLAAKERILADANEKSANIPGDAFDAACSAGEEALKADFKERVALLSAEHQVELMLITDREEENPFDIWIMDENIARFWLYSLIEHPPAQARSAYVIRRRAKND